jgi:hypothetical protein
MSSRGSGLPGGGTGGREPAADGGEPRPARWALIGFVAGLIGGFIVTLLYLMIR